MQFMGLGDRVGIEAFFCVVRSYRLPDRSSLVVQFSRSREVPERCGEEALGHEADWVACGGLCCSGWFSCLYVCQSRADAPKSDRLNGSIAVLRTSKMKVEFLKSQIRDLIKDGLGKESVDSPVCETLT